MQGLPSSWDQTAATLYSETTPYDAIWSPCNRFIAIVDSRWVVILDAATLSRLDTFAIPSQYHDNEDSRLSISPDGHCLTLIGRRKLISWDLQTGGPLRTIPSGLTTGAYLTAFSSTYSEDGKVIAVAYAAQNSYPFIYTYDLSGTDAGRHCTPNGRIIEPIWTHGKCIRFVTINYGSVAISEVKFTLKNPPVKVESLPIAGKIVDGEGFLFLPSLSRLAFTRKGIIQVWDAKAATLLLKSELLSLDTYPADYSVGSFSPNGHFFACLDIEGVARVWKESPAGYVLHQKLPFITSDFQPIYPCLSPSGESISMSPDGRAFHLWHTRDQVPSLPSISKSNFTLAFSPDERFAAFARWGEHMVTVCNPLTGDLQLTIDTNMGVVCLGMTGSALIVVGMVKIVTWDLPSGDCTFDTSIDDSVWTTTLHRDRGTFVHMSISPDFSRIAGLSGQEYPTDLHIYDISTGRCLTSAKAAHAWWIGFTQDGREVWTASYDLNNKKGWKIIEDSGSGVRLEPRDGVVCPSEVFPWESRRGYEVTGDGWVLSATQKRLLWLPHRWRSEVWKRTWSGRFLGLLHEELSEVVILEFPE